LTFQESSRYFLIFSILKAKYFRLFMKQLDSKLTTL